MTAKAIVAAAGSGRRMGAGISKVFLPLAGRPLLLHTLEALAASPCLDGVVVVVRGEDVPFCRGLLRGAGLDKVEAVVAGGAERQESVARGLEALGEGVDVVAVHDGARPLCPPALVEATVAAARRTGAALAALPVKDTIKVVDADGRVVSTPDRRGLFAAQTPQAFRLEVLREAFAAASARGWRATDEAALVEALGRPVAVVPGEEANLKVTTPLDLALAEAILRERRGEAGAGAPPALAGLRVGHGCDVHPLVPGRRLVLGGVEIPHEAGLAGHSDADAVVHALIDALLGAAGLGDVGAWFPDDDARFRGADSLDLLREVAARLRGLGWRVLNCDVTVIAERPRLSPHREAMRERLAEGLGISPQRVGVKATTTEGLGFTGRGEGIAAHAVALLAREVSA